MAPQLLNGLRNVIYACQRARNRIVGAPYTTALSRELEAIDELEDSAWALLDPKA
jgi:hypothetical protein